MSIRPLNFRVMVEEIKADTLIETGKFVKVDNSVQDKELVKGKIMTVHNKSLFEVNDIVYFKRSNGKEYKDKYYFVFEDDIEAIEELEGG